MLAQDTKTRSEKTKSDQYEIMIAFMESSKGKDDNWDGLTLKLNSIGPPNHTCEEWKKVWSDYKGNVLKKQREGNKNFRSLETRVLKICQPPKPFSPSNDVTTPNQTYAGASSEDITNTVDIEEKLNVIENLCSDIAKDISVVIQQQIIFNNRFEKLMKMIEDKLV